MHLTHASWKRGRLLLLQLSVHDADNLLRGLGNAQVVGDHDDGVAHIVQFPEQLQYFLTN